VRIHSNADTTVSQVLWKTWLEIRFAKCGIIFFRHEIVRLRYIALLRVVIYLAVDYNRLIRNLGY
jgi:hypothetical protein